MIALFLEEKLKHAVIIVIIPLMSKQQNIWLNGMILTACLQIKNIVIM